MAFLARLWQRLIDVPAGIDDHGCRRQTQLLAATILLLVVLGAIAILIEVLFVPNFRSTFISTAIGLVALLIAYALARRGHYSAGAVIAVTVVAIIGFGIVLLNPRDAFAFAFLVFGPFLAALFFSGTGVVVTTVAVLLGITVVLPAWGVRPPDGDPMVAPIFLTMVAALLVLYRRHRDGVEHDRQAELAASEAQFRSLAEAAHEGIVFAENGRIIEINARGASMLGAPRDAIVGRSVLDFCAPEFRDAVMQHIRSGSEETYEIVGQRADGTRFPQELRGQQTQYQGRPVRVTVFRDLSERRRAEQALAQSEANFRALTENANVGIMVNYRGKHVFANRRMLEMLGYSMDEFQKTGVKELVHPDEYDKVMQRYRDRQAGKPVPPLYETVFVTRSGQSMPVELTLAMTTWEGEPAGLVFLHDISERVRAQEALRRSEQQLRSVVSNVPVVLFTLDRNGVFTLSEGKGLEALGLGPGEVVGQSVFDVYADYPGITNSVRRALAGESLRTTNEVGQLIFDTWYSPLRDSHDDVVGTIGVAMDVSERVRAEEALRQSEERLRKVFEATATSISITRRSDGLFLDANQTLFDMTGWTREEVIGHTAQELDMWVDPGMREKLLAALVDRRAVRNMDWQVRCKSGRILSVLGSIEPIKIADTDCLLIVSQDITDRKQTEEAMRKLSSALEQTADSVLITDRQGVIEYVNPAFERTTGYRREEALGQTPRLVKSGKQGPGFYAKLWETILAGETFSDVFINRRKDGHLYYEEKTVTPLKDAGGKVTHFISTGKDVTERIQTQERLQYMAQHDALTDLPNRALLLDRLKQSLARARWHDRLVAVLFVDMDRFKTINDTLGHEVGDQLLQQLAARFQQSVREGDTVARFGGDEFVVLLDDVASDKDIGGVAQKVLEALVPPFEIANQRLYITASIGVSIFPNDGEDSSTLLRNADIAMYRAKELGKNTWQMYSADMSARAFERMTLENSLRHAIERDEFRLYYQPQVDVESGAIAGVEALLRWQHPEFGLVLSSDFIPSLEETGLIVPVGEWVLATACAQLRAWHAAGWRDLRVAVNLSPRQFHAQNFMQTVERAVAGLGGDPGRLEFEITEGMLLQHAGATLSTLEALRALGVRLAIDDFGTGYSSLSYLRRFPIEALKIDRSFVHDIPGDADDSAITTAIIVLAQTLKLDTVAEGVETEAQRDFLRAQGCRLMQGYLFSRPLPPEELTRLLEAQPRRA
jgi:diguanylate cyclase (GGDEF)-like protein/PAS domain S-box-containing protein